MTDQENNNSGGGGGGISRNPFAALFGSVADAKHFADRQKQPPTPPQAQSAGEGGGLCSGL